MSLSQIIEVVRDKGKRGLGDEYDEITRERES